MFKTESRRIGEFVGKLGCMQRKMTAGQIPHRLICFQQMIHLPV
ncbi:hypothetical protein ABAC460_11600 [Asticcacaulis sp. AC460]|nr:hypothetical protein ABAC460_11600 [Asticcacaulis sp. AC460]